MSVSLKRDEYHISWLSTLYNPFKDREHRWDFQQSGKQVSFKHILKSSPGIYESSGSQFLWTTTRIQSGPAAFDKASQQTNLGVKEICSFRLVLEGKTGKEIPQSSRIEFLETFLAHGFALSDAEDNTYRPLNRGGIADLPLLRTLVIHQKAWEPSFWEETYSFVLFAYASLTDFRFKTSILIVQTKKVICMRYDSSTSSWKP